MLTRVASSLVLAIGLGAIACSSDDAQSGGGSPTAIATAQGEPYGIAVDGASVYWAARAEGVIRRWSKATDTVTDLLSTKDEGPRAVLRDGDRLFFTLQASTASDGLWSASAIGGARTQIAPLAQFYSIATDATHVYWLRYATPSSVERAPKAGGAATTVVTGLEGTPRFLAVHGADVYWSALGGDADDAVYKAPIAGGARTLVARARGAAALAVDASGVYVASRDGVLRVPLAGGAPNALAALSDPMGLAIDDASVYFVDQAGGFVRSVPKAGGPVRTIASGQKHPFYVAVDATQVYWTNYADFSVRDEKTGSVMRAPK